MDDKATKIAVVADMVAAAERHRDSLSQDRQDAVDYYHGIMRDAKVEDKRSSVVSRDVYAAMQKVMPSIVRTLLANDEMVEYTPRGNGDEMACQQASDYINYEIFARCDGYTACHDACHDALLQKNGYLEWWYDERKSVSAKRYSGLSPDELAALTMDGNSRVAEQKEREDGLFDAYIVTTKITRKPMAEAIPPEEFLIHPYGKDEDSTPLIGRVQRMSRSDLVAMGYDRKKVMAIPTTNQTTGTVENEKLTRRKDLDEINAKLSEELQEVDYYKLYVCIDEDGDGIAELRMQCYAGKIALDTQLKNEIVDSVNIAILTSRRNPHQVEGESISEGVSEVQRVKTALLRGILNNSYEVNNPQPVIQEGIVQNLDSVMSPKIGQPIFVQQGTDTARAITYKQVPSIAAHLFPVLEYFNAETKERSGISDASGGLPADALQNMTATASAQIEATAISQVELMVGQLARGLTRFFSGLLRLVTEHQDKEAWVRLRDKPVLIDPRKWRDIEMDCKVNIGLGTGSRERDLAAMNAVLQVQSAVFQRLGGPSPLVNYSHLKNALQKYAEAAKLKNPRMYFGQPEEQEIQAYIQQQAQKPDPEMMKEQAKAQGQMSIEQMKLEAERERAQIQAQVDKHKETVQSQAAVEEKRIVSRIEAEEKDKDRDLKVYEIDTKAALELLKLHVTDTAQANQQDNDNRHRAIEGERAERNAKADRDMKMAESEMAEGADGKPQSAALAALEAIREQMSKPKKVKTPDGEEFVMQ